MLSAGSAGRSHNFADREIDRVAVAVQVAEQVVVPMPAVADPSGKVASVPADRPYYLSDFPCRTDQTGHRSRRPVADLVDRSGYRKSLVVPVAEFVEVVAGFAAELVEVAEFAAVLDVAVVSVAAAGFVVAVAAVVVED